MGEMPENLIVFVSTLLHRLPPTLVLSVRGGDALL
jgi:hypothetical protein